MQDLTCQNCHMAFKALPQPGVAEVYCPVCRHPNRLDVGGAMSISKTNDSVSPLPNATDESAPHRQPFEPGPVNLPPTAPQASKSKAPRDSASSLPTSKSLPTTPRSPPIDFADTFSPAAAKLESMSRYRLFWFFIIAASTFGILIVVGVGMVLTLRPMDTSTPTARYSNMESYARDKEWFKFWRSLDERSQNELGRQAIAHIVDHAGEDPKYAHLVTAHDREAFVYLCTKHHRDVAAPSFEVIDERIRGQEAIVTIKDPASGQTEEVRFVWDGKAWKLALLDSLDKPLMKQIFTGLFPE